MSGSSPLTPGEFSARFAAASRTLWLIAAAVLGRRDGADDVVQESAVIGLQKVNEFLPQTNFAAWMGGIVRNVARNQARKSIRRQTGAADPATLDQSRQAVAEPPKPPAFDRDGRLSVDQKVFDDRLMAALNELEEVPRVCLLLRTLHDQPYREIAGVLGIPEGTAMSHVHRARATLRRLLSEPGHGGSGD